MAVICPYDAKCNKCRHFRPDPDRNGEKSCWYQQDMALPPRKSVKTPSGETVDLFLSSTGMMTCQGCYKSLRRGVDYLASCPNCGVVYCEQCVADGTFDRHECEEDDEEED